jgi:hypothetical protein
MLAVAVVEVGVNDRVQPVTKPVVGAESAVQAAVAVPPVFHGVVPTLHERVVAESTASPDAPAPAKTQFKIIVGIAPKPGGVTTNCLQVFSAGVLEPQAVDWAAGAVPWVDPVVPCIQQFKVAPSLRKPLAKKTNNALLIAENIFV